LDRPADEALGTISVLSTFVLFGVSFTAFALGRGDRVAFFQSPARAGALVS
jgi:hypothetical protein